LESSQIEVVPQREKHIRPAHLDQQTSLLFPCETERTEAPDLPACLRFVCARVSARRSFAALSHSLSRTLHPLSSHRSLSTIEMPKS
jgi:hypothetical protein